MSLQLLGYLSSPSTYHYSIPILSRNAQYQQSTPLQSSIIVFLQSALLQSSFSLLCYSIPLVCSDIVFLQSAVLQSSFCLLCSILPLVCFVIVFLQLLCSSLPHWPRCCGQSHQPVSLYQSHQSLPGSQNATGISVMVKRLALRPLFVSHDCILITHIWAAIFMHDVCVQLCMHTRIVVCVTLRAVQ